MVYLRRGRSDENENWLFKFRCQGDAAAGGAGDGARRRPDAPGTIYSTSVLFDVLFLLLEQEVCECLPRRIY